MIRYNTKNWFLFLFRHGLKHVRGHFSSVLVVGIYTAFIILAHERFFPELSLDNTVFKMLGIVLGLLLVFRTNSAYDRWWEGRKQLGKMVNTTRNLAIKWSTMVGKDHESFEQFNQSIYAFFYTVKEHLRSGNFSNVESTIPLALKKSWEEADHKPNYILQHMAQIIHKAYQSRTIDGDQLRILENEMQELINILGACERIRNTPIPFNYALHVKRVVLLFSMMLPFAFLDNTDEDIKAIYIVVPIVMLVFYTMVGLELIAEEIEDPFGYDDDDLPVDELCAKVEANIKEIVQNA
ncbi:MAG: hypothetical protein CMN34_00180 [Saprospirales bacterium]|nr:hypothetical protein [Saprospirales bacterium]